MKRLSLTLVLLVTAAALLGCSDPNVAFEDLVGAIEARVIADLQATGNFTEDAFADGQIPGYLQFNLLDEEETGWVLEIDKELLAEGYALVAQFNINADKIIVLKARDKESIADVQAALEAELEKQDATWSWYLPAQYEKVKNNIIETQGSYLIYVTYGEPQGVVDAFIDALK
ncbi:MAG: DUF4358 domain-containing protein [Bacillota bacterium]|jgi:hypothetical protein